MPRTFEEMSEDMSLCDYCRETEYGRLASVHTLNGVDMCEGRFCSSAYERYLDSDDDEEEE